jgi:hypothetical protein
MHCFPRSCDVGPNIKLQKTGVEDDDFAKPPARF